jgi:hypothetical protein
MMIPDWFLPTIVLIPALLWFFLGVGIPWALALLPRADWRDRATVLTVALALGPALNTTIMLFIGTYGKFSTTNVLASTAIIAAIGLALATRNRSTAGGSQPASLPFSLIEITLIMVIFVAVLLRFWNTAYWPYTTYDEFWVYGYNAKIFMLGGAIPTTMGYYPQLVPLSYTYGQLMWGGLDAHAARTVVPVFALTSILMAYLLGAKLFNRRVGLLTAAIWALYPHNITWSQFGDLEVPITLYFTATVTFFILGWRDRNRRYIVLSGILMGAALWTKPTAAALPESFVLILISTALYWLGDGIKLPPLHTIQWQKLHEWWKSSAAQFPILALIVAAPMGGMWYVRNFLLGLDPIVLPEGYWQRQAQRSGQELGWLLLIVGVATLILIMRRERSKIAIAGFLLCMIGSLPSAFGWRVPTIGEFQQIIVGQVPGTIFPTRLTILEIAVSAVGVGLLIYAAKPLWFRLEQSMRGVLLLLVAFIVPYFVTWFWSYSYHFRLSFAIVPLLIVLLAVLLDVLIRTYIVGQRIRVLAFSAIVVVLALPGWTTGLIAVEPALSRSLPDDHAKIARGNTALMGLVDYLNTRRDPSRYPIQPRRPMRISAPGELRLPFFFPLDDIRTTDYPIALDQLADVDYFIDSSVGQRLYLEKNKGYNQILASLTRENVFLRLYTIDDLNFRFSAYAIDKIRRFVPPTPNAIYDVQIGDFARLVGIDLNTLQNYPGESLFITLWWQAFKPADLDYSVFIHLWNPTTQRAVGEWSGEPVSGAVSVWNNVPGLHFNLPYHTRLWQPGETIKDEWKLKLPNAPGTYELRIGLFDPVSGRRLPITRNGIEIGDSLLLSNFTIQ